MSKYLTREQVVADFNANFSEMFNGLSDDDLEHFWNMNLDLLLENNRISQDQRKKWVFNKKDLHI
jgi:hypothetical protein